MRKVTVVSLLTFKHASGKQQTLLCLTKIMFKQYQGSFKQASKGSSDRFNISIETLSLPFNWTHGTVEW